MQDTSTGLMHRIPSDAPAMRALFENAPQAPTRAEAFRAAMAATIKPENQGAVFEEGEVVEIKGARFKVQKIIKKGLVLHGLPKA